ncbi:ras-related and estrogen-regulated growth inhibitor-like isoform X1 [Anguilla anguilla]|uniref:ras-related and estrogen-regulated growth inhibitor-like isoform X1 n=1 Tax=Anguilla anguilla TaxID=7936 RepID=UPI0015ABF4F3|nr:ras-related and estrogen-regulated growth inhibitor-like isoform X1 [Anguilla anguilla]
MMTTNFTLPRTLRRAGSLVSPKTVRIVILGQAAVGKTALTVRFITKRFIGEYDPTLETIYRHDLSVGGDMVRFEILDTAGQEEDALLIEEKIKWGDGFVIVYSVTDRCSFNEVMRLCFLVNHVHSAARKGNAEPPPIVIVANKKDLEFDRMVTTEDGENLSKGLKLRFHEVSAREGCDETAAVFHALCRDMVHLLSSSPTSFRRRAVSKLMEKIPRIHSSTTLGSATALGSTSMLGPTAVLSSSSMLGPTSVLNSTSMLGPTAVLSSSSMLGPTSVLNSSSMLGPTSVLNSSSMLGPTSVLSSSSVLGPSGHRFSFSSFRDFPQD